MGGLPVHCKLFSVAVFILDASTVEVPITRLEVVLNVTPSNVSITIEVEVALLSIRERANSKFVILVNIL